MCVRVLPVKSSHPQISVGKQGWQGAELRGRGHHMALAADFVQPFIEHAAGVGRM
jgi:hypothetical protein